MELITPTERSGDMHHDSNEYYMTSSYHSYIPVKKRPRSESITSITSVKSIALSDILDGLDVEPDSTHIYVDNQWFSGHTEEIFKHQNQIYFTSDLGDNDSGDDLELVSDDDNESNSLYAQLDSGVNCFDISNGGGNSKKNGKQQQQQTQKKKTKKMKCNSTNNSSSGSSSSSKGNKKTSTSSAEKNSKNSSAKKQNDIHSLNEANLKSLNSLTHTNPLASYTIMHDMYPADEIPAMLLQSTDMNQSLGNQLMPFSSSATAAYDHHNGTHSSNNSILIEGYPFDVVDEHNFLEYDSLMKPSEVKLMPKNLVISTDQPLMDVSILTPNGSIRIGAYTREERQQRINRFRAKKMKRIWRKQIKYDCRKKLADTRPRVKGRFVSRAEELVVKDDDDDNNQNDDYIYASAADSYMMESSSFITSYN